MTIFIGIRMARYLKQRSYNHLMKRLLCEFEVYVRVVYTLYLKIQIDALIIAAHFKGRY